MLENLTEMLKGALAMGKGVLEVTGNDVASFCDDLIKDSKTFAVIYRESVNQEVNKAMKKVTDKHN